MSDCWNPLLERIESVAPSTLLFCSSYDPAWGSANSKYGAGVGGVNFKIEALVFGFSCGVADFDSCDDFDCAADWDDGAGLRH